MSIDAQVNPQTVPSFADNEPSIEDFRTRVQAALNKAEFAHALAQANQAASQYIEAGNLRGQATALYLAGQAYRELDDTPAALKALQESFTLWEKLSDQKGMLEALRESGGTYFQHANYPMALDYFQRCRSLAQVMENRHQEMISTFHIGTLYIDMGDIATGMEMLTEQCLPYFTANGKTTSIAAVLHNIASGYSLLENHRESIQFSERSLPLLEAAGDHYGLAYTLNELGAAHRKLGDLEVALAYYRKGVVAAKKAGFGYLEALLLEGMGDLLVQRERFDEGQEALERALTLNGENGHQPTYVKGLTLLGKLYANPAFIYHSEYAARDFLTEARGIAEGSDSPTLLVPVYSALAELLERLGDFQEALHCQRLLQQTERRVFNEASDKRIKNMQMRAEVEKARADAEIARLRSVELAQALQVSERLTEELNQEKERLQQSEERLQALVTATELMMWTVNAKGNVDLDVSAWCLFTGLSAEELRGWRWINALHPEDRKPVRRQIVESLRIGFPFIVECRVRRWDGEWCWLASRVAPVHNVDDTVREWIGSSRDITARKDMEEERRQQALQNQRLAAVLQEAVLTSTPVRSMPGASVCTFYQPTSDEAAVGGDFYDVFPLAEGKTAFVVGDVLGHGLAAAISIAEVRFALRAFLSTDGPIDPGQALAQLNNFLIKTNALHESLRNVPQRLRLVALTLVIIDPANRELSIVSAGMEPGVFIRPSREGNTDDHITYLDAGDLVLGAMTDVPYRADTVKVAAGDLIAVTTDGITEVFNSSGTSQFGVERLGSSLSEALSSEEVSLQGIGDSALQAAQTFSGGVFRDDVCLLLIQIEERDQG